MQQPEPPKIYDIYGVEYNPWFLQSWFIYSVIGLVVFFVGYIFYSWYNARKKPAISYTQQTLNGLDALEKSNWSDHKDFYIRLTMLLKWYLQKRYEKQFIGTTDAECLQILRTDRFIPEWIASRFENLIEGVMFVKFANAQAAQERMQEDFDSVKIIVTNTQLK